MFNQTVPHPFAAPLRIGHLLATAGRPWFICGGWAIDLLLNKVTRSHNDVDVAILRRDQLYFRQLLKSWTFDKAANGTLSPWPEDEFLELPWHEVWCHNGADKLELLLNESNDTEFLFRRDTTITLPLHRMGMQSAAGLPILAPEIVLLYKAKRPAEERNKLDFQGALPALGSEPRRWLTAAISRLDQDHAWLMSLGL